MKKFLLTSLMFLLLIQGISAIRINEVELNPEGTDAGYEWIELYSEDAVDLESYRLVNNDGDFVELEGTFSGYYVYTFSKQWLDNEDEKVFLYKNDNLIDNTDLLKDNDNDDETWQFCDNDWELLEQSTKSEENDCENGGEEIEEEQNETEDVTETDNQTEIENQQNTNEEYEETEDNENEESDSNEVIELTTKAIKSEDDKEELDKSKLAMYGFVVFCVLLGILFLIKKRKMKNEFEE